ncbi:hypothetical protein [Metabacillus sp. 84]|uniref:hypothetical protein n=1 Tax=Metabacillus sp. 84 TaxID=3404705 RepID=UPI003CECDBCC
MVRTILFLLIVLFAAGCTNDKPRPEGISGITGTPAASAQELKKGSYSVHHFVKGNTVFVECFFPNGNFGKKKDLSKGELFITVTVDGKNAQKYFTPAFSIHGLKKGYHEISLEVSAHNEPETVHSPYSWTVKVD